MKKIDDESSRERILAAAIKLFAQKGFDNVSIREICKEAGVNVCMISYYFGGKNELYQGIIDNLIEKQSEYMKTFVDITKDPSEYSKQQQVNLLITFIDKLADFLYSGTSKDLIILLLKEQQNPVYIRKIHSPGYNYLRRLVGCVFNKDENDRETILKTLFIISQVNSPKIIPAFALRQLGQDSYNEEDIKIIKENAKFYINAILKEAKVV